MWMFYNKHIVTETKWEFNIISPNNTNIRTHLLFKITCLSINSASTIVVLNSLDDTGIHVSSFDKNDGNVEHIPSFHDLSMIEIIGFGQILGMIVI